MKNIFIRIISYLLVSLMLFSLIACGSVDSETKENSESTKNDPTNESLGGNEEKPDEKPNGDTNETPGEIPDDSEANKPSEDDEKKEKPSFDISEPIVLTNTLKKENKTISDEDAKYFKDLFINGTWSDYSNDDACEYTLSYGGLEIFYYPHGYQGGSFIDKANDRTMHIGKSDNKKIASLVTEYIELYDFEFSGDVKIDRKKVSKSDQEIICEIFSKANWKLGDGSNAELHSAIQFESIIDRVESAGFYYSYDGMISTLYYNRYALLDEETSARLAAILGKHNSNIAYASKTFPETIKIYSETTQKADVLSEKEGKELADFLAGLSWRYQSNSCNFKYDEVLASFAFGSSFERSGLDYCKGGFIVDNEEDRYAILKKSERDFLIDFIESRIGEMDDGDITFVSAVSDVSIGKLDENDKNYIMSLIDSDNWKYDENVCSEEYLLDMKSVDVKYCTCGKFSNGLNYSLTLSEADKEKVNVIIDRLTQENNASYSGSVTVENVATGKKKTLDTKDAETILSMFNSAVRTQGNTGTSAEYLIKIGATKIYYNLIGVANDVSGEVKFSLSWDDKTKVDSIIEKYVGKAERYFSGVVKVDFYDLVDFTVSEEDAQAICDFYNSRTFYDSNDCDCALYNHIYVSGYTFNFADTSISGPFGHAGDTAYVIERILRDYINPDISSFEGKVSAYVYTQRGLIWLGDFSVEESEYLLDFVENSEWKHNLPNANLTKDFQFEIRSEFDCLYIDGMTIYNPKTNRYVYAQNNLSYIIMKGLVRNPDKG